MFLSGTLIAAYCPINIHALIKIKHHENTQFNQKRVRVRSRLLKAKQKLQAENNLK